MAKKNGTTPMLVTRLYGRCLMLTVNGQTFEVKVMGERTLATTRREQLLGALLAGGAQELVLGAKVGEDADV